MKLKVKSGKLKEGRIENLDFQLEGSENSRSFNFKLKIGDFAYEDI